mgnify:FL=1|tara:strand:+ start:950 stop:1555 length:606 start_codon:yes stop_codon:yes gene_type:complete
MFYLSGLMPTYRHKETGERFFFIHIPRTAGRFLQENIKQNGFESEQNIWGTIDGVEITHLHREMYEEHLEVKGIPHISVVRDPLERYISLKSYTNTVYPKGWFRPSVEYVTENIHIWYFEDGFGDDFSSWISSILKIKFIVTELKSNYTYNQLGQKLILEYMDSNYQKNEKTFEDVEYVKDFYKLDYLRWSRYKPLTPTAE